MKLYGWEDYGPDRGEIVAAVVHARDLDFGSDRIAASLGWDRGFTPFKEAQTELVFGNAGGPVNQGSEYLDIPSFLRRQAD